LFKINVNHVLCAELVGQREIGAESRVSMVEVCRLAGRGEEARVAQATAMLNQLEMAWRQRENAVITQRDVESANACVQRLQCRVAAHAWLYDFSQCRE
jgi:hypothetical protein